MRLHIGHATVDLTSVPDSVDLVLKPAGTCAKTNERFDGLQLVGRTGLKSARIVKDEAGVGREDQLIIDVMIATLKSSEISSHQ